jgi:CRP-like cAMP-binding protein
VRLSVSVLGYTVTIGRDGGTEDQHPAMKPPRGSSAAGAPGADRPRRATIPDRLMKPRPHTLRGPKPLRERSGADTFWDALNPGEKRDFNAVAQPRTFAAGATLMHEGEPADHVIVVLSGRTKVCVYEDGRELLLGERGPGELIGERAALEVSVRSATVVALDMVRALVVPTPLFAEFISAHPRVLGLVEGQVYARLTESPESVIRPRRFNFAGENCTVVLTDVEGFSGYHRNEDDRKVVRRLLYEMTRGFLEGFGAFCSLEDRGDGFLLVVPPGVPTSRVMERLLQDLPPRLRRHNHTYSTALQIRLRVAATVGPVTSDLMGVSGDAIISAARLVEAPVLKQSMLARRPNLGVIASAFVYETAIRPAAGDMDFAGYEQVQVTVKESSFPAWMKLIDPEPARGARGRGGSAYG